MASGRSRLLKLAEWLGATVYSTGQQWCILHYGIGDVIEDPISHSAWDCLGRLAGVAMMPERLGGLGIPAAELQQVAQVPWRYARDGGTYSLQLPDGIDGTADAILSRLARADMDEAAAREFRE